MDKMLQLILLIIVVLMIKMILIMWGWSLFMVPVFGMKALSAGEAFGFSLLASCFAGSSLSNK